MIKSLEISTESLSQLLNNLRELTEQVDRLQERCNKYIEELRLLKVSKDGGNEYVFTTRPGWGKTGVSINVNGRIYTVAGESDKNPILTYQDFVSLAYPVLMPGISWGVTCSIPGVTSKINLEKGMQIMTQDGMEVCVFVLSSTND